MDRNNLKSEDARERLISLIDEKKSVFHGGAAAIVRREFGLIAEARKNGASWKEIVNTIGFPGKEDGFAVAFFRECRRVKKEKEVVPEKKKWVPAPKEEKKESPGVDRPAPASGVRLVAGKSKKNGACEAFNRLPSID